ncbi:MAG: hypothetical protein AB1758_03575, partial [Candidatus Eremiobacterota bacterium]
APSECCRRARRDAEFPGVVDPPPVVAKLLQRYPWLACVHQALEEHARGEPITARCLTCGDLLKVEEVHPSGSRWVACPRGCHLYRERRVL